MPHLPSRRDALTALPLLGGAALAGGVTALGTPAARAATPIMAQQVRTRSLGFTIGGFEDDGRNLDRIVSDLDEVAALGGTAVRMNVGAGHLVQHWGGDDGELSLRPRAVEQMHWVLDAAADRGLMVYLIYLNHYDINIFDDHEPSDEVWLRKTEQWWRATSREFAPKAGIVQVFNEASGSHYRRPVVIPDAELPAYLEDFADKISRCRGIVHEFSPDTMVTTNLYGWPVGEAREEVWMTELRAIHHVLDLVTVDAFVDWNDGGWETLNGLTDRLWRLREAFGKPVAIGEFGVSTYGLPQETQADRLELAAELLTAADSPLHVGFLFQLRDADSSGPHESSFGVMTNGGSPKLAYSRLRDVRLS